MLIQIFLWGGWGFPNRSQETKNGFCLLAFLMIASLHALLTISLQTLRWRVYCSFLVKPIVTTSFAPKRSLDPTISMLLG
jgi:hypothetical protein